MDDEMNKEPIQETPEGAVGETPPASTAMEENLRPLFSRLKKSYPDQSFEKDDDYLDMADKHIQGLEEKVGKFEMSNKKILSILEDNPELKGVFADIAQGTPFAVALARNIDLEAIIPLEGEPNYEEYANEDKARRAKIKENQEYMAKRDQNLQASVAEIEAFATESNMDEDKAKEFLGWISELMGRMTDGSFDKQLLRDLYKAYKHDEIMAEETQLAEIRGKNAKIDEMITQSNEENDGLPFVEGSNAELKDSDGTSETMLDDAFEVDKRKRSVYDEGRAKRV